MSKYNLLFTFCLVLGASSVLVFCLHLLFLEFFGYPLFDHMIILAYVVNTFLALVIFSALYIFRFKWRNQIGFLFLGGSMLKFLLFFIVFNPVYKSDGNMESLEFTAFFTPYLLCLLLETIFTARMLNKM
ncbi:MAG: hypothetical protein ACI815_001867 [Psychroserpens sp.]|jgi:hypothetical protein